MPVTYEVDSGVGVITLDRPDVLNAFDDALGGELLEIFEAAATASDVRCIVVTGSGRAFSAGEDLGALAGGYSKGDVPALGQTLTTRYNPLIRAVRSAPKPVVAAVNGVAAGAGASLALACDYRIASEHAKLVIAFVKVGLVPDSGALWFLARMVGTSRAWELAASGRAVGSEEAASLGLFHRVLPADAFDEGWRTFAGEVAQGPTRALALTKALLYSAAERSLDEQLDLEVEAQSEAGQTADHLEGVQAFLAKRPPNYQGR